jgi:pimeloyl-ACP methyl ester carboxylesterase
LKLPTLFLVGQYDEVRVETARDFQARVPGSILRVIPDAGHGIQRDQPEAFNDVIVEFIEGVERR